MSQFTRVVLLMSLAVSLTNSVPVIFNEKNSPENDDSDKDILDKIEAVNQKADNNLFEADIKLGENNKDVDEALEGIVKRNAQRDRRYIWKSKVVPYVISQDLSVLPEYVSKIQEAIGEFHIHSCVKFVPRTNQKNWIDFVMKPGCYSKVGQVFWRSGGQDVSIGQGCNHKGVIMHELLHALGFWHEQSRPDRNQYVEILWENIKAGKEHNFNKYNHGRIDRLKATYDVGSIMHYGKYSFSKNGKPTIQSITNPSQSLGQTNGFSQTDIFEINALYNCKGQSNGWSSWSDYGPCNSNCKKLRQRFCSSSDASNCPGANQYGVGSEEAQCPPNECNAPIDGHWGRWSSWSQCSSTCGQGAHTRTRQCDDPKPQNGGKQCPGSGSDTGICLRKSCGLGPDDCEFEIDTCIWSPKQQTNYRWLRQQGTTPSSSTGPDGDATKPLNGKGFYIYAESSSPVQPNQATELQSKTFPATSGRCIQFAYNMYGGTIGSLTLYVENAKTAAKKAIFTKSGDQGQTWFRTEATITSSDEYKVVFEVIRGSSWSGDVALDDIIFKDGKCAGQGHTTAAPTSSRPSTARPTSSRPSTARPTTSRPFTTPQVVSSDDCNFDQDMCSWKKGPGTITFSNSWARKSGRTPSYRTGPSSDHTSGSGSYVYVETSSPAKPGQTATLVSKAFPPVSAGRCLSFFYHMYGGNMGTLNVYVKSTTTKVKSRIFTISGDQGNKWHHGVVNLSSLICDYEIVFESVRGPSYRSDMALDDITFTNGACPRV